MKFVRATGLVIQLLVILPLQLVVTSLLYSHVQATAAMWAIWIASVVISSLTSIVMAIISIYHDEKALDERITDKLAEMLKK